MSLNVKSPLIYLLGSDKVKLLKLFLRDKSKSFTAEELSEKTHISLAHIKTELRQAIKYHIIDERKDKKQSYYTLNPIEEVLALEPVIFRLSEAFFEALSQKIDKIGQVELCIVMGLFLQRPHDRLDLFLVANEVNEKKFNLLIEDIQAELAQEITYTILSTKDFEYRKNMFDKFVSDVLEHKHSYRLIDKLTISSDN